MSIIDYIFLGLTSVALWAAAVFLLSALASNPVPWIILITIFLVIGFLTNLLLFGVDEP